MSRVANICKASRQRGNALVLLLLLKTWDGAELPDHYELAELANISPRQAERDLQKLIDDGEAERVAPEVKGRGHVTRFRLKESTSHVSDKTTSDVTDFKPQEISPSHPSGIPETTSHLTDLSDVKPVTSDVGAPGKYVTSDGTPLAPYSDLRTSTDKNINNDNSARVPPAFTHEVSAPIQVYRDVFGTDPPAYGQDVIESAVKDVGLWRAVCEQWKGNNNDRTKAWNMVDAYRKKVTANANGDGREKQAGRRDDAPRRSAQENRKPDSKWGFKNSAGG